MTFQEYKLIWARMSEDEKNAVRKKAEWEAVGLWAAMQDWPSLVPDRLKGVIA